VRALHDDAGNIVADLDHDSYGNPQATVESVVQPYRFTGREYDRDTGLYQYRAREYDPVTGRFLQEDPIWFDSGDMNVYRYTWNNPVMWRDPSGMSPAIEYGCLAQFALGAGTSAGSTSALGSSWLFTRVPDRSREFPAVDFAFPAYAAKFPVTFVGNSWPKRRKLRANIGQLAPGNRESSLFPGFWALK
jgi:RHS repeat-associated protein